MGPDGGPVFILSKPLSIINHTVGGTQLWLSNASRTVNHKQMLPEFDSPHWPEDQLSHSRVILS